MQIRLFFISIQRSFLCFIVTQSGHTFAHGAAFGPNGCSQGSPFQSCRVLVSGMRAKICLLIKRHALRPVFLHPFCNFKKNVSKKKPVTAFEPGEQLSRPLSSIGRSRQHLPRCKAFLYSVVPHDGAVGDLEDAVPERMRKFRVVRDNDDELFFGELL